MNPEQVEALFTREDGQFVFARWGRPIAPVVFGVEDETLGMIKGGLKAVIELAGHDIAETDPELGSNLMIFFLRDWQELLDVRDLAELIPELPTVVARLEKAAGRQYRAFRFDAAGAVKACFVFLRMDEVMLNIPVDTLVLDQSVQAILLWSERAFSSTSPLAALPDGTSVIRPEIADVIRAAYHPTLPSAARDPSHALRLYARLSG
ncbi:MAG: hypothetical protein ABJI96_19565 [Paracoccaceae bacterium]